MLRNWEPSRRVFAVRRLARVFREKPPVSITRGTHAAGGHMVIRFRTQPGRVNGTSSGNLIDPDNNYWAPQGKWHSSIALAAMKEGDVLRLRMRDLRRCGITPSHAAKLVLEHYYREG